MPKNQEKIHSSKKRLTGRHCNFGCYVSYRIVSYYSYRIRL